MTKLGAGYEAATAALVLPEKYRRRLWTTNMLERLIAEVRRRERVIRIFPNVEGVRRMIGTLLYEQHGVVDGPALPEDGGLRGVEGGAYRTRTSGASRIISPTGRNALLHNLPT